MRAILLAVFAIGVLYPFAANAQPGPDEDAMVASNVCQGAMSEIVRAQGGRISANVGQYKIDGANGSVTISKGERNIISGMTYDAFARCVIELKNSIAADRKAKASRIERQFEIFDVTFGLGSTLNIGTCLLPSAQAGLYAGDMSQGDGRAFDDDATYKRLNAFENTFTQRAQRLFGRNVRLDLADQVKFFRFMPGRSFPYFDSGSISTTASLVPSLLTGNEQIFGSLGMHIGLASQLFRYYTVLPTLVQMAFERGNPRAPLMQAGVQQSQQCIFALYPDLANRIQAELVTVGCDVTVPQLSDNTQPGEWTKFIGATRSCLREGA